MQKCPGKQTRLLSLIEESIRLDREEEERFQKIIRDDPMYQEANMLESIEELGMERALEKVTENLLRSGKLTGGGDRTDYRREVY